ncbi:acyltransferase family protein [Stenotrophomonas bentonitica]
MNAKNEDIQVLRAVAIVMVVLQHYRGRLPTPAWYQGMFEHVSFWAGVDVFFAISGYLIYRTFSRDMQRSDSKLAALGSFAVRRFRRLYPTCLFWIVVSIALAFVLTTAPNSDPWPIIKSGFAGLTGWSNLYYVMCVPDYVACGNADFNGVTWSLSAEWQFYAVLSTAMLLMGKKRAVIALLAIALVMSAFPAPSWSFFWAFRPLAFMLGALIAMSTERTVLGISRSINRPLLLVGVAMALLAPVHLPQPCVVPAISLGGAICLLSSLAGNSYSGRMSTAARWIGERSYSIYLCHLPSILIVREVLTRTVGMEPTAITVAMAMTATVVLIAVLSDLSYRFVELRFQRSRATAPTASSLASAP